MEDVRDIKKDVKDTIKEVKITLDIDKIRQKKKEILNKIANCEDDDKLDKLLSLYDKLDKLEQKCKKKDNKEKGKGEQKGKYDFPYINTKEDYILLKNLFEGTECFEDWHLVRLLTRVRIIDMILKDD